MPKGYNPSTLKTGTPIVGTWSGFNSGNTSLKPPVPSKGINNRPFKQTKVASFSPKK